MAESFLIPDRVLGPNTAEGHRTGALARVRVLVRLRFVVMWNTLRRHPWQLVGVILGAMYGLGILAAVTFAFVGLAFAPAEIAKTTVILTGSGMVLGWIVGPIVSAGMDRTLDPSRLVAIPMRPDVQLTGIAAASLLGIPGLITLLVSAAMALVWFRSPAAAIAAILIAPVAAVTCVLACQLAITALSRLSASRRFREIMGGLMILVLVLLGPIVTGIGTGVATLAERLPAIAEGMSWSPLGAVWAVPGEVASGALLTAVAKLMVAVATVCVLTVAWRRLFIANMGTSTPGSRVTARAGSGWFARFPDSPRGAVAARALTYWLRDPRYLQSLIVVLVMPVVFGFVAVSTGLAILLPGSAVAVAVLVSLSTFTDISYDGTAFSTHVLRGVRGIDDRLGRVWANAIVGVPLITLVAIVTTAIAGRFDQFPTLLGLVAAVTLGGFGVASVCSAVCVMPVPQSGENPFASKPGAGTLSLLGMAGSYGSLAILSLPAIGFSIAAGVSGEPWLVWSTLAVGLIGGATVCWVGVRWGSAIFDRRTPELFARVVAQR